MIKYHFFKSLSLPLNQNKYSYYNKSYLSGVKFLSQKFKALKFGKQFILILLITAFGLKSYSQNPIPMGPYIGQQPKRSAIRAFLSKFTLSLSTGRGTTYYKHQLTGVGLVQKPDSLFIFDNVFNISNDTIPIAHIGWFSNPIAFNGIPIGPNDFVINTDTAEVIFKAKGKSTPFVAMLHFKVDRYWFGAGAEFEFHKFGTFKPTSFSDSLQGFSTPFKRATFKRYFGVVGGTIYQFYDFSISADAQFGIMKYGKNFNPAVIQKGIFFNLGVNFEWNFSEYFQGFVRPSYELKNYTITIPEAGLTIDHKLPAFFLNIGVRLRLPELKKCIIKLCKTQINHVHWGREFRSRVHPIYKTQNPDYGENHKKLLKYKGKNKRKRNPF